ncbi:hypothetical protein [Actinotalea sp.]|uniref:hypothetical protein n=1 Tax=Actinotalea sp. TaxID=1872145 RepID=UPI003566E891
MSLDTPAGYTLIGALALVVVGLLLLAVASTRLAGLLGMREDARWWFSPAGGRTQGLVAAYVGSLVAVGALVYLVAGPGLGSSPALAWTLSWMMGLALLALSATRMARLVVSVATEGRTALDEPDEELFVVPDGALGDVDLIAARTATERGEWRPAAELLAASVDDDMRYARIVALAVQGLRRSRWLDAWLSSRPTDPNAQAVRAMLAVRRAWELRGPDWEPRNAQGFLAALREAEELTREAIDNDPLDPSPRAVLVEMARGQQVDADELDSRTRALFLLAPHHQGGHEAELHYRSAKWFGSDEEMLEVARAASAAAPPGSALALLVVTAHVEHYFSLAESSPAHAERYVRSPAVRAEVSQAVDRWTGGPDGASPVNQAKAHNTLAFYYWLARDRPSARPHLAHTLRHLDTWPWALVGDASQVHAVAQQWAHAGRRPGGSTASEAHRHRTTA